MEQTPGALIAMSGGVDSSVAAYLMQQKGYRCMGITMRQYSEPGCRLAQFPTCCSPQDIEDAKQVAFQLDMPYEVMDFSRSFRERVIDKFVRVYESGGTPNPCIDCNRTMRFASLLEVAKKHDLDYVVTGHYARVAYDEARGRWLLKKAAYEDKDQSYMLCMLTQDQLAHIRERPEAGQCGHLLYPRRGLRRLYGALYRKDLSRRRLSRSGGQRGGTAPWRRPLYTGAAKGAGPCHGHPRLRLR